MRTTILRYIRYQRKLFRNGVVCIATNTVHLQNETHPLYGRAVLYGCWPPSIAEMKARAALEQEEGT